MHIFHCSTAPIAIASLQCYFCIQGLCREAADYSDVDNDVKHGGSYQYFPPRLGKKSKYCVEDVLLFLRNNTWCRVSLKRAVSFVLCNLNEDHNNTQVPYLACFNFAHVYIHQISLFD